MPPSLSPPEHGTSRLRVMLYSHDTMGLGHIRRNQTIAHTLAETLDDPSILVVSGARQCTLFDVPRCVEFVTVPAIRKAGGGTFEARNLNVPTADVFRMRRDILLSTVRSFEPHVLIVDKVPLGVSSELVPSLEFLRSKKSARCVLGLRDILDSTEVAREDWQRDDADAAIDRYYDAVWVYGDSRIHDYRDEAYLASATADKMHYVGYLNRQLPESRGMSIHELLSELGIRSDRRLILGMVGGGEDGEALARAFVRAALPADATALLITGPYMASAVQSELDHEASLRTDLCVVPFCKHTEMLIDHADQIISMGGYNTVCEILSYGKSALIVPRVEPREEQLIRAERMSQLGLLEMVHPHNLSPQVLSRWLAERRPNRACSPQTIRLDGLQRLPRLLSQLVASPRQIAAAQVPSNHWPATLSRWSLENRSTGVNR